MFNRVVSGGVLSMVYSFLDVRAHFIFCSVSWSIYKERANRLGWAGKRVRVPPTMSGQHFLQFYRSYGPMVTDLHFGGYNDSISTGNWGVTNATMQSLKGNSTIVSLNLGNSNITTLVDLPSLTRLYIYGRPLDDEGLRVLGELTQLTELTMSHVDDEGMARVAMLVGLKTLDIWGPLTDDGLNAVCNLPITDLSISRCPNITDAGFGSLRAMTSLKRIDVMCVPITDAGLAHLAFLGNQYNLAKIRLRGGRRSLLTTIGDCPPNILSFVAGPGPLLVIWNY
jgi:hypothetical protein